MNDPKVISFQIKQEEFYFLGIENLLTENADFGAFWDNFFHKGGYDKIAPYQKDPNCINIWFKKTKDKEIYYQGKIVCEPDEIPEGYTLRKFQPCEYLVVTTEWLSSNEEALKHINHDYYKNAEIPTGYKRLENNTDGIFLIERWGAATENGFRYEFWLPIEKI